MPSQLTRDERQELGVQKWVDAKLRGTLCWATGTGKTRGGILAIKRFQSKNPTHKVLVVVPSEPVERQWVEELAHFKLKATVITMNMAAKNKYVCSFLIIDEIHRAAAPTLVKLFENIKFKIILGLTATFERTDGRDRILAQYAPVIDTITIQEAVKNGWLSKYREYKVLIESDNLEEYEKINREFQEHFSFFDYDFNLAMSCNSDWKARLAEAKRRASGEDWHDINKQLMIHAAGFNRTLQARKKFIHDNPKKTEIAKLILEKRADKKCITFSSTIAQAERLAKESGVGKVYSGKDTSKKGRITLDEFKAMKTGVIHSIYKLNEGFNDPSIQVGIVLGFNSSATASKQRIGRVIRANNPDEEKEIFTLVLKGTQDEKWAQNSLSGRDFIVIDEEGLRNLLDGKEFTQKIDRPSHILFRF